MTFARRGGLRRRLLDLYWLIVGTIGLGQPVVDRWDMYGDGPSDDPYSLDWAPTPRRRAPHENQSRRNARMRTA